MVTKKVANPVAYTFYVGVLGIFALAFAPFGFFLSSLNITLWALLSGSIFLISLFFLFTSLFKEEASRVFAVFGGCSAVFVLAINTFMFNEVLKSTHLLAIILLIAGGILILYKKKNSFHDAKNIFPAILAAFLSAVSIVMVKQLYIIKPFFNVYIWIRIGFFLTAMTLLLRKKNRQAIFNTARSAGKSSWLFVIGNKALAGLGAFLINVAVAIGSVSIVYSMQGIQYAFIFIFAVILSVKLPSILHEELNRSELWHKILAILLIGGGLIALSL
ncbi:hypothetical protein D4R87_02485 [bacterium]|nr:MAG: hypothetical protein D4R87_02485 [bacterium]